MLKIGSHVSMSGKEMMLHSVKEAISYEANTFMIYTGAPQNTKRKPLNELKIKEALSLMQESGIEEFVIHAPYLINLANTMNANTFQLSLDLLQVEIERTIAMKGKLLILHPGAHVGAGIEQGIDQIVLGLNQVLTKDMDTIIALETMAGKGSEIGFSFEQLTAIFERVHYPQKLRVCFDTCHTHDAGYDICHSFDQVIEEFDRLLGVEQIAVFHINDSKNICGAKKDRHANIGEGKIGLGPLQEIVHHPLFLDVPKILETPYRIDPIKANKTKAPYKEEIALLRRGKLL